MKRLSRLLSARKEVFESLKLKDSGDRFSFRPFSSRPNLSTPSQKYTPKGDQTARIFAPYSVYKGKAALSLDPLLPTFTKLESGNQVVNRRGAMILRFLPAIGERKYDWEKRQVILAGLSQAMLVNVEERVFALSPTEIGTLLNLGPKDSCEFFHDPSMLSSNAGQVKKSLSIKSIGEGTGYFVSLSVANNLLKTKESFTVPVTASEFAVMKTACSFALPHIIGWDRLTKYSGSSESLGSSKMETKLNGLEWEK